MRRPGSALLLLGAVLATSTQAAAAPVVVVRGRPSIELAPVRRVEGGIEVRGRVTELAGGEPLAFLIVDVAIDGRAEPTQTDGEGRFRHFSALGDGIHELSVEIDGDPRFAPARVDLASFDVEKRALSLSVSARDIAPTDGAGLKVMVSAEGDDDRAAVTVEVRAGPLEGPTVVVGALRTADDGYGELEVPLTALGGAGRKLIEVVYGGDDVWDAASGRTVVTLKSTTAVELRLERDLVRHEGRLIGSGQLTDASGAGLALQPIALRGRGPAVARGGTATKGTVPGGEFGASAGLAGAASGDDLPGQAPSSLPALGEAGSEDGRVLADLVTDADGAFAFSIAASEIGQGRLSVQAEFEPISGWLVPSRSPILTAEVEARRPVPVGLTLGAFAATAMALGAFVALRTRPWDRWRARLRPAPPVVAGDAPVPEGLAQARPGLVGNLRRASDFGFAGTVRSSPTGRSIAGAVLRIEFEDGSGPRLTHSDGDGAFEFGVLPRGRYTASVTAPGHVATRFPVAIPHRGELVGARVDLVEVRERVFSLYREVAEPLLPRPGTWGVLTPRQIFDAVRLRAAAPALAALTDYVEEKFFSQRTPEENELAEASRRVDAARFESSS